MSCDPEIACVLIQIERGSIVDTLKNKVWFDTDVRARNASLSTLCQLVESRSSDLAKRPEFVNFFALLATTTSNCNYSPEIHFEVKCAFCCLARESSPLVKDFSTVVTSLFAISRDVTDARATLLEFASKKSHRRALAEQEQVLTHISALIQDPDVEVARLGSQLLRLLLEDTTVASLICFSKALNQAIST